ncbi:DNA-3-methyladenine glycosylase I [Acanthopleuribacter pedis]|uniref:DNA-3-methyladenine glycosylase I n=1 Tax=Acanthopleuribacter pedis TaxID=442870 RepID=A0A8J7QB01_9BACT|nr:DNA-3-methyladenine glycosylase I [Acanthopleuribacter pedis]MBO1320835.1 DNA-3-methyladenine glycosylase I [Acanthopleuribacter pedis]
MEEKDGLARRADGSTGCWWSGQDAAYIHYHDTEWGFPVADDQRLFEKICLEGFQSGLSWITILRKRENFRAAFHGFDFERVAKMDEADVDRLMQDTGIVRNRRKIEATLNNARQAIAMRAEFGSLAAFFWQYEPDPAERPAHMNYAEVRRLVKPPHAEALAKALKKRGWRFVGPTTAYAFMQAMGLVNDHLEGCIIRERVTEARAAFTPPRSRRSV